MLLIPFHKLNALDLFKDFFLFVFDTTPQLIQGPNARKRNSCRDSKKIYSIHFHRCHEEFSFTSNFFVKLTVHCVQCLKLLSVMIHIRQRSC